AGATALSAGRSGGGRAAALARISGIGLGLALASFFWLPALLWMSEVRTEQLLAGKFDFHGNFAALGALFGWDDFFGMGPLTALALELLLFALCTLQALPRLLQYEPLPAPVRDRLEPALAPAALLRSPLPATVGEEYLPRGASLTAWQVVSPRLGPLVEWGGARVEVLEDRGVFARLRVSSETEVTLRWARWAFPQWRLDVNGS